MKNQNLKIKLENLTKQSGVYKMLDKSGKIIYVGKAKNLKNRVSNYFIKSNQEKTFFAYLSFYAVHAPIQTTQEKWLKYQKKAVDQGILEEGFSMEKRLPIRIKQDNPVYAGLLEQTDEAVGHVLNTLDELKLDENTVVVFVSDNGGVSAGDDFATSNLPLRGGKGYQWRQGLVYPFLSKLHKL